jgi:hypothetical protein
MSRGSRPFPPSDRPVEAVRAAEGEIVLMGDHVSVSLTPEAALESAERIRRAAEEALAERPQDSAE